MQITSNNYERRMQSAIKAKAELWGELKTAKKNLRKEQDFR